MFELKKTKTNLKLKTFVKTSFRSSMESRNHPIDYLYYCPIGFSTRLNFQ